MAFQQEKLQKTVLGKKKAEKFSPALMGPSEDRDRSQSWDSLNSTGSPRQSGTAALPFSSRMWQPMAPCPFCARTHTRSPGVPRPVFHSSLAIPSRAAAAFPAMPCLTVSSAAHSWALTLGGHEAVQARLMCGQTHLSRSSKI